jgi:hypothetical protein
VRVASYVAWLCIATAVASVPVAAAEPPAVGEPAADATESSARWARPPVSLRGGYTLDAGEIVVSYRFERQGLNGLQTGRQRQSAQDVLDLGYQSAPEKIDADRHVFGVLWAPFDELTFQLELPFVRIDADRLDAADGESFRTKTNGFGDVLLWVLYRVYQDDIASLHLNLGLSFPSGSITETQDTPLTPPGVFERLPYALQLGSGTVDLRPGFTYRGRYGRGQWGFQALANLRAGSNHLEYTLGNVFEMTSYGGWAWNDWLQQSFSLRWQQRFDGTGSDAALDPAESPLDDANLLSGRRLDALFDLAVTPTGGAFRHTRWVIEAGLPAFQDLDGPQPRTKWLLQFAVELTFD